MQANQMNQPLKSILPQGVLPYPLTDFDAVGVLPPGAYEKRLEMTKLGTQ
jgi:hypothetical protein